MALSVVTGGAGFVGSALVGRLIADGDRVRAVVAPNDPFTPDLLNDRFRPDLLNDPFKPDLRAAHTSGALEIVSADVTDWDALAPAFAGATRVFHTAALVHAWAPWERFQAVNVGGARNVARAALEHGVERLVHVSTTDVFGFPEGVRVLDERSPFRRWREPYADTKIEAEQLLWTWRRERSLPLTVIYPGWVYGPGDRAFFPGLAAAIAGGFMLFWARGIRLAWAYVDNLVDACVQASELPQAVGEGFIVYDTLDGPSLEDVSGRIAARIGAAPPTWHVPYAFALAVARVSEGLWRVVGARSAPPLRSVDVKAFGDQWRFSNAKARRELGWSPRVGIDEGMERALDALMGGRREV